MAALTGSTIADTYKDLLQVSNSNSGVDATARAVSDGEGTASLLYLSTTEVYSPGTGGTSNTAFGKNAGDALASNGNYNVVLGEEAGTALTTGLNNVAVGYNALSQGTTESDDNVAIGYNAMSGAIGTESVNDCIAIGSGALSGALDSTDGADEASGSIAIGKSAMAVNTIGAGNVAIGGGALLGNIVGSYNTAIGYQALEDFVADTNNHGQNTCIGYQAGKTIDDGTGNTAIGSGAMNGGVVTGNDNVSIGVGSMATLVTGANNIAIGNSTLASNTNVDQNIAIGSNALTNSSSTSSSNNIAIGANSMDALGAQASTQNTCVGIDTMTATHSAAASQNVCMGYQAGTAITEGDSNVCVGYQAGVAITTGSNNTFIGPSTAGDLQTGSSNIQVGKNMNLGSSSRSECIMFGHSYSGTAEAAFFGNDAAHIRCDYKSNATWQYESDERMKNVTGDSPLGLDFLNDIRVVTYTKKPRGEYPTAWQTYKEGVTEPNDDFTHHGVLAQEVKAALDDLSVDYFHGWSQDPDGSQRIGESAFIYPLIKAVQELSAKVTALENA